MPPCFRCRVSTNGVLLGITILKSSGGQGTPRGTARDETAMYQAGGNDSRTTALLTAVGPTPTASAMFLRPRASASSDAVIMRPLYPQFVDPCNTTNGGLRKSPQFVNVCPMAKTEPDYPEIAERLARIRKAFSDLSQKDWAGKHGFNQTQYNNWEKGSRRIPVDDAEKLCGLYGLTLDFIYRGRRDGLSESASKAL